MRVSSVISTSPLRSSAGTLKSTRTSTRFPRASRSRMESLLMLDCHLEWSEAESRDPAAKSRGKPTGWKARPRRLCRLRYGLGPFDRAQGKTFARNDGDSFANQLQHSDTTIAVAPLVVVPTDDFYESPSVCHGQLAVENARMRIAENIAGNERFVAVFKNAVVALITSGVFKGEIDRFNRRVFLENGGEVGDRTIRRRDAKRAAIQFAF